MFPVGPSTPIVPSSKAPAVIPRTPSSTIPHPSFNANAPLPVSRSEIYERNLHRKSPDVSFAAVAYLFSEIVQYANRQSNGISDMEKRLNQLGYHVGQRVLELTTLRKGKNAKREITTLGILQFIMTTVWKTVFGRPADGLQKSNEDKHEYMIFDNSPMISQFVSVPKNLGSLNCAAYAAGIIEAILDGQLFTADVTAHSSETSQFPRRTVYLIRFEDSVVARGV